MDTREAHQVIRKVAKEHGVSKRTVVREIEIAIKEAIATCRENNDVVALREWEAMSSSGRVPNAYEVVAYFRDKIKKELEQQDNW